MSASRRKTRLLTNQYHALRLLCAKNISFALYKALLKESKGALVAALAQCSKNLLYNKAILLDHKLSVKINQRRSLFVFLSSTNNTTFSKRKKLLTAQKIMKLALPPVLNYFINAVTDGSPNTVEKGGK